MKLTRKLVRWMGCVACALLVAMEAFGAGPPRIVAIGDIHGSYPQLVRLLRKTKVIDSHGQWIGGETILVQLGDVPDRGTRTRDCLDLLMHLEDQAAEHNGRVYPLLGNHEAMVMIGDLRYVRPEDYRTFVTERSKQVRDEAYQAYEDYWTAHQQRHLPDGSRPTSRKKWLADHPLGLIEFRDAFGPHGQYGSWLRKHDTVVRVDDMLFLHGGVSPRLRFSSIDKLNEQIRSELARFDFIWQWLEAKKIIWRYMTLEEALAAVRDELAAPASPHSARDPETARAMQDLLGLNQWLIISPDGPLWYRGYAWEPEENLAPALAKIMTRFNVRRMIVAHTITDSRRIASRFDNRVFLIDTGMMLESRRQGRASALEIESGRFVATYAGGGEHVLLSPAAAEAIPAVSSGGGGGSQHK